MTLSPNQLIVNAKTRKKCEFTKSIVSHLTLCVFCCQDLQKVQIAWLLSDTMKKQPGNSLVFPSYLLNSDPCLISHILITPNKQVPLLNSSDPRRFRHPQALRLFRLWQIEVHFPSSHQFQSRRKHRGDHGHRAFDSYSTSTRERKGFAMNSCHPR